MARYITVYMDDEEKNYYNEGLYGIIAFIGNNGDLSTINLSSKMKKQAYINGKRKINAKLNGWNSTAIENLIVAHKRKYQFNYSKDYTFAGWKIHRKKAIKIFAIIYSLLTHYKNKTIVDLFNNICGKFFLTGADAAGSPYYSVIKDKNLRSAQNYNQKDEEDLEKCALKIAMFSEFH